MASRIEVRPVSYQYDLYWDKPNGIVLNTQSITAELTAPAQYLVTDDGQIYGTNPMRSNLSPGDMKKL